MTMSSFCMGLKGRNPKLDIFENFGTSFLPAILARLFTDVDKALPGKEQWDFTSYLYFFAAGMASLDTHLGYRPIVDDIIACADERIASGEKGADLRFGHDYTFLPLLMTLNVEGFGHDVQNPDDIPYWCQLQRVPMGANLHFVFYRSKKSDKILFKVLQGAPERRRGPPAIN